jgi:hypothetical protein
MLARLGATTMERQAVTGRLASNAERLRIGAERAMAHLGLLQNLVDLFRRASDEVRCDLLGALFVKLVVYVEDDAIGASRPSAARPTGAFVASAQMRRQRPPENAKTPRDASGSVRKKTLLPVQLAAV